MTSQHASNIASAYNAHLAARYRQITASWRAKIGAIALVAVTDSRRAPHLYLRSKENQNYSNASTDQVVKSLPVFPE